MSILPQTGIDKSVERGYQLVKPTSLPRELENFLSVNMPPNVLDTCRKFIWQDSEVTILLLHVFANFSVLHPDIYNVTRMISIYL